MNRRNFWINQILFQLSWPACVIGAGQGLLWPSLVVVGAFAAWQLAPSRVHALDRVTLTAFVCAGLVLDTLWQRLGVVEYALVWPVPGVAPLWLLLLWAALGLTVNHSLAVFKQRWAMFAMMAAVGSPLSYSAAAAFGAVTWAAPGWVVVLCMGPIWGLIVGLLFRHAGRAARPALAAEQSLEGARG